MPEPEPPGTGGEGLRALLEAEAEGAVPPGVVALCDEIRRRHGEAVAAVLFYGSNLRRADTEGVIDFYVLVDRYRPVHRSAFAAALGWLLPPNVFYLEHPHQGETLRTKYAVVATRDFLRLTGGRAFDCRVWSRFCQPSRRVYTRDAGAGEGAARAVEAATLTALRWMLAWLPGEGEARHFEPAQLWRHGFRETYAAELRGEQPGTIDAIYAGQAERFDAVLAAGLELLASRGELVLEAVGPPARLRLDARWVRRRRLVWPWRRRLSKAIAILGQLKTPLTFEGWAPYALWKLERHSGVHIELTERQRRHPLIFGWPVILRILREGLLR